jgi:hypothetical protein
MTEYTVYSPITGAILRSITVSEADLALNINAGEAFLAGHWPNDTYYITAGVPVALPPRPSNSARFDFVAGVWRTDSLAELAQAKAAARAEVTGQIAALRAAQVTDLPGQEMIYLAKEAEARAWLMAADPDLADFPLIAAEIGITGQDAAQVAQVWINLAALWRGMAAALEPLRLTANAGLDQAETPGAVADVLASFTQDLTALSA